MKRLLNRLDTLQVGETFQDLFDNDVQRASRDSLFIGPGLNAAVPEGLYIEARKAGTFYGHYPLSREEYRDLKRRQVRTQPDPAWELAAVFAS